MIDWRLCMRKEITRQALREDLPNRDGTNTTHLVVAPNRAELEPYRCYHADPFPFARFRVARGELKGFVPSIP